VKAAACIRSLACWASRRAAAPALVREVGRQVALLPSYAIAREELARRGLDLDIKELYRIGKVCRDSSLDLSASLAGADIVGGVVARSARSGRASVWACSSMAGRTENRTVTRRQKGKGKNKQPTTALSDRLREPKLLIIVELDERGRMGAREQTGAGRHVRGAR